MADRKIFQDVLDKQMKKNGINQTDLANAISVSKSTVNCWLTGRAYPRIDVIQKIADVLNCSTDYLVTGIDDTRRLSGNVTFVIDEMQYIPSEDEMELLLGYQFLNDDNKSKLLDHMRVLKFYQKVNKS